MKTPILDDMIAHMERSHEEERGLTEYGIKVLSEFKMIQKELNPPRKPLKDRIYTDKRGHTYDYWGFFIG